MTKQVLICEDTDQVVQQLKQVVSELTGEHGDDIEFDQLTTARGVAQLNPTLTGSDYDLVLLDYFAPDGNFHGLDIEKIGVERVVAISSMPGKNSQAKNHGVLYSVAKQNPITDDDLAKISEFAEYILYTTNSFEVAS